MRSKKLTRLDPATVIRAILLHTLKTIRFTKKNVILRVTLSSFVDKLSHTFKKIKEFNIPNCVSKRSSKTKNALKSYDFYRHSSDDL